MVVHQNITNLAGYFHFLNVRKIPYVIWFSADYYYSAKLTQAKAMGYTVTLDQVKASIDALGGPWAHYEMYGYKESYVDSTMQTVYIPLQDSTGAVVFDAEAYCTSKLEQLNGANSPVAGQYSTWMQVAKAITGMGYTLYGHYAMSGQYEGLVLNENFSSENFYKAKLAYLQAHPETFGTDWDMEKLMKTFQENGLDAYQNWLDYGKPNEGITDAMVAATGEYGGITAYLTTGADVLTGTNGNDKFYAYAYGDNNTLNTGDQISGGGGRDTLFADIVESDIALMPIVTGVEVFKFQVQKMGDSGTVPNNVNGYIDAQRIAASGTNMEMWSVDSRDHLVIEDVRILSTSMTVGMQNTDPGAIDYLYYFDGQHLASKETQTDGNLYLQLIDSQGALAGHPLNENAYDTVKFHYNGEYYSVNFGTVNGDATYQDLCDAINTALQAAGLNITATTGASFTQYDGLTGAAVTGTTIILEGPGKFDVSTTTGDERDGWEASAGLNPDNSLSATMTQEYSKDCPLYQTNVALDNVGRVVWGTEKECLPGNILYGSTAGNLVIGSMATRGGVQRFDVTVDRGSWLNSMSSTNNDLRMITVKDYDWSGNGVADGGPLFIGAHPGDQTYNAHDVVSWQAATRFLAFENGNGDDAGIWDVKYFDSSSYSGNVNIAAQFTAEAYDKYLADVDGLHTVYDNYAPKGDFQYNFGVGNDTLNMAVNGGIATDRDFKLIISMGDGEDWVNFKFDFKTLNQAYNQVETLQNVSIDTGAGNDKVWTWGTEGAATVSGVTYDGVYGYLKINTGAGDDVVYAAQEETFTNYSVWVVNADTAAATAESALGIDYTAVGEAQPINNNVQSTLDSYTFDTNAIANGTYKLYVEVEFLGIVSQVLVGQYPVTVADPEYTVSADALNKAIISAIEGSQLKHLLSAKDGAGYSLLVQSLIVGEYDLADFNVNVYDVLSTDATVINDYTPTNYTQQAYDVTATANADGADALYYGYTEITGGDGNDVLVIGYANSTVLAGAGNDIVIAGNETHNLITGGTQADIIILGETGNAQNGNNDDTLFDTLFQARGDTGVLATVGTTATSIGTLGFDIIHNFDVSDGTTGNVVSDQLVITAWSGTATLGAAAAITSTGNQALIDISTGANDAVRYLRGTYDATYNTFVQSGTGDDMLLAYDTDTSTAIVWEAVVLTGVYNTTDALDSVDVANTAAGAVITMTAV